MIFIHIALLGAGILVGALGLNALASSLGLMSWYEFLKEPSRADLFSYLWLFVFYPFGLGFVAFGVSKLLTHFGL